MEEGLQVSAEVQERVEKLWSLVFTASAKIIKDAKIYGFTGIGQLPAPNVHDMVRHLQVFGAILDILYSFDQPYEQQRQILNAKRQIATMEQLAAALIADKKEDYEEALAALEKQCVV